jgi:diguanylate cyclase (GGDEF)-like protein
LTAPDNSQPPWISGEFDLSALLKGAPRILNRGQFLDHVDRQLQITRRSIDPRFAVLLCNLDNYADIVTEKGKQAADAVVRAVVEPIGALLSRGDAIAILPDCTIGVLIETARLRGTVQDFAAEMVGALKTAAAECSVKEPTASVGIAKVTGNYVAAEDILRDAQTALSGSESGGRDQITLFHRGMDELPIQAPIAI